MKFKSIAMISFSSTLYKSITIGLDEKPYNTKPVGGASCPAGWHWKSLPTFSQVNQTDPMVKISPAFLKRLIDTVCYTAQMYKVEFRTCLKVHL